jgi:urease accessory protein
MMAMGGALGVLGLSRPGTEIGIALSVVGLGAMVATETRPPLWFATVLVAFLAIFHGQAHLSELPPVGGGFLYSIDYGIGLVAMTGLLNFTGVLIGLMHGWKTGEVSMRRSGIGVLIVGGVLLRSALI